MARSGEKLGQKPTHPLRLGAAAQGQGDGGCALPDLRRLEKHPPAHFLLGDKKKKHQLSSPERLSAIASELGRKAGQCGEPADTSPTMLERRPGPARGQLCLQAPIVSYFSFCVFCVVVPPPTSNVIVQSKQKQAASHSKHFSHPKLSLEGGCPWNFPRPKEFRNVPIAACSDWRPRQLRKASQNARAALCTALAPAGGTKDKQPLSPKAPLCSGKPSSLANSPEGTERQIPACEIPQPSPSSEGSQPVLVRPDPTFYILSCHCCYYCPEMAMLVQSAWVHQSGVCIPKHIVFPFAGGISAAPAGKERVKQLLELLGGAVSGTPGNWEGSLHPCHLLSAWADGEGGDGALHPSLGMQRGAQCCPLHIPGRWCVGGRRSS